MAMKSTNEESEFRSDGRPWYAGGCLEEGVAQESTRRRHVEEDAALEGTWRRKGLSKEESVEEDATQEGTQTTLRRRGTVKRGEHEGGEQGGIEGKAITLHRRARRGG